MGITSPRSRVTVDQEEGIPLPIVHRSHCTLLNLDAHSIPNETTGVQTIDIIILNKYISMFKPIHFRKLSSEWEFDGEKWLANQ